MKSKTMDLIHRKVQNENFSKVKLGVLHLFDIWISFEI
jgi:hypothetical protein